VKNITRIEAVKKMGKYATLTALSSFVILSCKSSQCHSPHEKEVMKTDIKSDLI